MSASLSELQPPFKKTWSVAVDPFDQTLVGDSLRTSIYVAFGAVVMVLLIACANIANLLLAKGVDAEQGDGRAGGARGQPRPARRADADREPGPLSPRRSWRAWGSHILLIDAAVPLLTPSLPPTANVGLDLRVLGFAARRRRGGLARGRAPSVAADLVREAVAGLESGGARVVGVARRPAPRDRGGRSRGVARADLRRGAHVQEPAQAPARRCRRAHRQRDHDVGRPVAHGLPRRRARHAIHRHGLGTAPRGPRRRARRGVDGCAAPRCQARRRAGRSRLGGQRRRRFKRVDPRYFETLDIPVVKGRGHQRSRSRRRASRRGDQRDAGGAAGRAVRHDRPGREDRSADGARATRTGGNSASRRTWRSSA